MRYSSGTSPTTKAFTGQRTDSASRLDYYTSRYYDPTAGQFASADTVADGLNRYAYVHGNPETTVDPSGHCPWCVTLAVGALVGGVIGAGSSIVTQVSEGKNLQTMDWGTVAKEGAIGAVSGAVTATLGPEAGWAAHAAMGAAIGAGSQLASNALEGRPLTDNLLLSTVVGGVTGGITGTKAFQRFTAAATQRVGTLAGKLLRGAVDACGGGESFSADTLVATPTGGEQAISRLQVGDSVTAYDPASGKTSAQTVQGQPVQLCATVTPASGTPASLGSPSGTVTFYDAGAQIGTATLGSGKGCFSISSLALGTHSNLTAKYGGDPSFLASMSAPASVSIGVMGNGGAAPGSQPVNPQNPTGGPVTGTGNTGSSNTSSGTANTGASKTANTASTQGGLPGWLLALLILVALGGATGGALYLRQRGLLARLWTR